MLNKHHLLFDLECTETSYRKVSTSPPHTPLDARPPQSLRLATRRSLAVQYNCLQNRTLIQKKSRTLFHTTTTALQTQSMPHKAAIVSSSFLTVAFTYSLARLTHKSARSYSADGGVKGHEMDPGRKFPAIRSHLSSVTEVDTTPMPRTGSSGSAPPDRRPSHDRSISMSQHAILHHIIMYLHLCGRHVWMPVRCCAGEPRLRVHLNKRNVAFAAIADKALVQRGTNRC